MTAPDAHVVVVGASLAGTRAAESLRRHGFAGRITLVGAEDHFPPVDRPPLSKSALSWTGDEPPLLERIRVKPTLDADMLLGRAAVRLDVKAHRVRLDDDSELDYDGLVVATGATARWLPGSADLAGVHVLRTADDALRLRRALATGERAAVVGAGVLGCEIAATCRRLGLEVDLIDLAPLPMLRVVGADVAPVIADLHRARGVRLHLGRRVLGLAGSETVAGVYVEGDGGVDVVPADVVVVAIGAAPGTDWLVGSGLEISDGVVCDARCLAVGSAGTIAAAGDVARQYHPLLDRAVRVEHWTNAVTQSQVAAQNLLASVSGIGEFVHHTELPYFWSDQYDWKLQVVGMVTDTAKPEEGSPEDGRFVVSYRSGGRLVGALCVNMPGRLGRWRRRLEEEMT